MKQFLHLGDAGANIIPLFIIIILQDCLLAGRIPSTVLVLIGCSEQNTASIFSKGFIKTGKEGKDKSDLF